MPDGHLSSRRDFDRPCPSVYPAVPLVNLLMAADAQALQIIFIVSAAVSQWQNVVNKLCCLVPSLALAHLAKRMVADVPVPNSSPPLIITFVMVVATGKVLVVVLHQLAVVFAVAALVVGQLWAALVSA